MWVAAKQWHNYLLIIVPVLMSHKPIVSNCHVVAQSRLFTVESMDITFSNGEARSYERLLPGGNGAVMMVPITQNNEIILIREYAAGMDQYNLTLPKGAVDLGEALEQAANRELQEEIKLKAGRLDFIKTLSLSPSYMKSQIHVFIAQDLTESPLEGDEPEPLDVVKWPLADLDALVLREDMHEGRAIAALYLAKQWFENTQHGQQYIKD